MKQNLNDQNPHGQERRRRADWVTRAASILSAVAWLVSFVTLLLLERARPEQENFFTHLFGAVVDSRWNTGLIRTAFLLLALAFVLCAGALIFNALRQRRKSDKYKKSILILGALTLAGLVLFYLLLGAHL